MIKAAPTGLCRKIAKLRPDRYQIVPDRKNWDYLYRTRDLIELRGRKYQQKRNHINRFKQLYRYTFEPLRPQHLTGCLEVFHRWAEGKEPVETVVEERLALEEALKHMEHLSLKGAVILIDGKVEAFSIGSLLNRETALIHFEKANQDFSGIYSVINQHFAEETWAETKYINREDDMGIPGLRQAKERYHPTRMVEKYIVMEDPSSQPDGLL